MTDPKKKFGVKKPSLDAVPPVAIFTLGSAMADGARKYGAMNYRGASVSAKIYYNAAMRHWMAWWDGEDLASDSGMHHLGHAMACACIILDAEVHGTLEDDRPVKGDLPKWLEAHTKAQDGKSASEACPAAKMDLEAEADADAAYQQFEQKHARWAKDRPGRRNPDFSRRPARVAEDSGVSKQDAERISRAALRLSAAYGNPGPSRRIAPYADCFVESVQRTHSILRAMFYAQGDFREELKFPAGVRNKIGYILSLPYNTAPEKLLREIHDLADNMLDPKWSSVFRRIWLEYAAPDPGAWDSVYPSGPARSPEPWKRAYLASPMSKIRDFNFPEMLALEWMGNAVPAPSQRTTIFNPARIGRKLWPDVPAADAMSPEGDPERLPDCYNLRRIMRDNINWITDHADVVHLTEIGSEASEGVQAELHLAKALGIPVIPSRFDLAVRQHHVAARWKIPIRLRRFLGPLTVAEENEARKQKETS